MVALAPEQGARCGEFNVEHENIRHSDLDTGNAVQQETEKLTNSS